jgi:hypothetical protein
LIKYQAQRARFHADHSVGTERDFTPRRQDAKKHRRLSLEAAYLRALAAWRLGVRPAFFSLCGNQLRQSKPAAFQTWSKARVSDFLSPRGASPRHKFAIAIGM